MTRSFYARALVSTVALAGAFVLTPVGCAATTPKAGVMSSEQSTSSSSSRSVTILPHPAFAYAQGTAPGAVSISDIAERALPSVVNISSTKVRRIDPSRLPFYQDPFFRHFFGPGGGGPGGGVPEEQREQGLGSGVVVSADGIVLTNNHVVEEADEIKVTTSDKREFGAKILGTDAKSDLAVIKLDGASGLKPIELGDSSALRLGDVVLAIGNPFGVGQTVTMGIVSAKGRANVGIVDYEDFIQTDAAINPGNSGGALVDMQGKLVGINTAILSRSGGYMGIGFAIPTNMAKPIMESLKLHGKVVRGWLGVSIQDVDQDLGKALGLPSTHGVLVSDVSPGGPADKAGLKRGDVVLKIDGKPVESTGELRNLVAAAGTGMSVDVEILRNGKPQKLAVRLGEMPSNVAAASGRHGPPPAGPATSLDGLTLEPLNAGNRKRFEISNGVTAGLVVVDVERSSPAARAGLRPGDVLLEIDRQKIDGVDRFREAWQKSKGPVLLLVHRGGNTIFLVVRR